MKIKVMVRNLYKQFENMIMVDDCRVFEFYTLESIKILQEI